MENMTYLEKIEFLKNYNKWRRGEEIPQPNPTEIGVAINDIVEKLELINKTRNELLQIDAVQSLEYIKKLFELITVTKLD
jgi:hypothetical protein